MDRKISVIIVNWNGEKWLKKCLDSLFWQKYRNFEVIVVDNASEDKSAEYIKKHYPGVIIIQNKENYGFAKGNNIGINKAKGKYILLINNDTWVENDFISKLVKFYEDNKFDVIAPREAKYNGEKHKPYVSKIDPLGHPIYFFGDKYVNREPFYLTGSCLFFPKKIFEETKGFDDNFFMYNEEVDWFWRLNLLNKKYSYVNDIYIYHASGGSSGSGLKYNTFLWRNQNTLQMLLKNYSLFTLILILPLYLIQNIFEALVFLIFFKPKIAYSYLEGWVFNIKNIKKIVNERKWVQSKRLINDFQLMKRMYFGSAKLHHLLNYLENK